jgi:hypothetical protein
VIGTPVLGAVLAHLAFWVLLALGLAYGELGRGGAAAMIGLWIVGFAGLPRVAWWTAPLVTPWVAVLDIVLVFAVFKADVKLG